MYIGYKELNIFLCLFDYVRFLKLSQDYLFPKEYSPVACVDCFIFSLTLLICVWEEGENVCRIYSIIYDWKEDYKKNSGSNENRKDGYCRMTNRKKAGTLTGEDIVNIRKTQNYDGVDMSKVGRKALPTTSQAE